MTPDAMELREVLETADFDGWYADRSERRNARQGKFGRNSPSDPPPSGVHQPHALLECHRKRRYREENAPAESQKPRGLFWTGTRLEEDVVLPFLDDATPEKVFVGNDIWMDSPVETDWGEIRLRGLTDPVLTDRQGTPILPTEVKTKQNLGETTEPSERHRAQLHAYLYGLADDTDSHLDEGVVIYFSRTDFTMQVHRVTFDEQFWRNRVIPWMTALSRYREASGIPPAEPEQSWECNVCDYRIRCGQTNDPVRNVGYDGFVPGHRYPYQQVRAALDADEQRRLPPTLATRYPTLAAVNVVSDWVCERCGATFEIDDITEDSPRPTCTRCAADGIYGPLRDPHPDEVRVVSLESLSD